MRKPTPATIIASIALFFSLTGASVAATRYLITSANQIRPSVREALRGAEGPQGVAGPAGPQGPTGPQGPQGQPGLIDWSGVYLVHADSQPLTTDQTVVATCRASDRAITGGFDGTGEIVTSSIPYSGAGRAGDSGWEVTAHADPAAASASFSAWALCSN